MRAISAFMFLTAACGSSSPPSSPGPDAALSSHDASSTSSADAADAGFTIDIGTPFSSNAAVTVAPATSSGVYAGYFTAQSDLGATPSLSVSIHADNATLAVETYPCARSTDDNDIDETAVTIQWLDGNTYYTNLMPSPTCTVTVTSATQTEVAANISGTIYNESDDSSVSFAASFQGAFAP